MVQPKWMTPILLAGFFATNAGTPAAANNTIPDAETLIKACKIASREDRESGVTARMRYAANRNVKCLQKHITAQTAILVYAPVAKNVPELIQNIERDSRKLFSAIFTESNACNYSCGTMATVSLISHVVWIHEHILRTVIAQRKIHRL